MNSKITSVAVGIALVLGVVGLFVGDTTNPVVERTIERVGGASGPEHTELQKFFSGFTSGSKCSATSTTAAVGTLSSTELGNQTTCVDVTPNGEDLTLTLAASTTGWYPKEVGSTRTLIVRNATTTAGIDVIFAAGTGINLKRSTSTGSMMIGDTDGENYAIIDFKRQADGDVTALLNIYQD